MKKFILGVIVAIGFLMLAWTARAEEFKAPPLTAGVAYSIVDNKFNHVETLEIVKWKGLALSGGYMGDSDSTDHKLIASLNYEILSLSKYVEWPIAKYVTFKPGIYAGWGSINMQEIDRSELDWGISLTVLQTSW